MPTYQDMKATAGNAPTKMIDPMTGMPVQTSMVPPAPPAPSNTLGNAQPVFNDSNFSNGTKHLWYSRTTTNEFR
jgi:hypothetical protein